jgi:thiosulfate dehydrogenase [quinone] large subunit
MGIHARPSPGTTSGSGPLADWGSQPIALRILRAFLGVTFVYAGIQKFADPNFLHAGTADYIGSQLQTFSNGSPIGVVLRFLAHAPWLTGVGIALVEIAVGVGTLLGVARFVAAAIGFAVSAVLFLSATWHVHPYFLGSDSMYAVAWLAYLAGLWETRRRRTRAAPTPPASVAGVGGLTRRQVLRGATVGAASILLAGAGRALMGPPTAAASGFGSPPARTRPKHPNGRPSPAKTPGSPSPNPSPNPSTSPAAKPAVRGRSIASLDSLPVGGAVPFNGPGGEPCALFRLGPNELAAYSRVCTHAGCVVGYDPSSNLLVCPCHGAEFDPTQGAAPVAGPAPTPLSRIRVVVDRSRNEVVLPN